MSTEKTGIAKNLKMAMLDKGITQVELAGDAGIPIQTLRNQLHRDTFTVKKAMELADLLNCDIVLMDRTTKKVY